MKRVLVPRSVDGFHIALAVVVLVGLALRLQNLGQAPLWVDESFSVWAAENFLRGNGFSDPVGPSSPYRRGWLTTTLPIAASFAILGASEFAARLPTALVGTLTIVLVYLLGARFHRLVGLLAALFVALDPFMLVWARDARMYAHLQLLYLAAIYLSYRWGSDHDLRFRSRYLVALTAVVLLGIATHQAFLAFGVVFLAYVSTILGRYASLTRLHSVYKTTGSRLLFIRMTLWPSRRRAGGLGIYSLSERDRAVARAGVLLLVGLALAGAYFAVRGMPSVLVSGSPAQWPTRGYLYYWTFLNETYPLLSILAVAGVVYLLLGNAESRLVAFGLVVPFVIATLTARKAPRYVYYLLPVMACVALVPVVQITRTLLAGAGRGIGPGREFELARYSSVLTVVFLLVVTPPAATFSVTDGGTDTRFHPARSDYDEASAFVAAHAEEDSVVMSTRPELSMWYLGETDYFFRQNGLKQVESVDGRTVHTRTGTVVVTNQSVLEDAMNQSRPIWLFAGKKFQQGFTSNEMRTDVTDRFVKIERESWQNMALYYWSPFVHQRSFGDADDLDATAGNAFVASIEGSEFLALGRTADTTARFGEQGDATTGRATMRLQIRPGEPMIVRTRTYGSGSGERYVNVSVSTDGENWRTVSENRDDGWATTRTVVPGEFVDSDELLVRIEGGSEGQNALGGLVDYVHVSSVNPWERDPLGGTNATDGAALVASPAPARGPNGVTSP